MEKITTFICDFCSLIKLCLLFALAGIRNKAGTAVYVTYESDITNDAAVMHAKSAKSALPKYYSKLFDIKCLIIL